MLVSSLFGHRHQHVGVVGAGLAQHRGERGLALHGADVEAVAEVAQAVVGATTVMSLASLARCSASVPPTWPAPI